MAKLNVDVEQKVIHYLQMNPNASSKSIYEACQDATSYASVKRMLQQLLMKKWVMTLGKGKSTVYALSPAYALLMPMSVDDYFAFEIDERSIHTHFNFSLLETQLHEVSLFTKDEYTYLDALQSQFSKRLASLTPYEYAKAFEHLAIDLSWKSSQIEGNTYSLLETERLLKERQTASGKSKDEAVMLLNHKQVLDFILDHPDYLSELNPARIEDIHSMLVQELQVPRNIRNRGVGVTGTNYKPLDNVYQIREALDKMCALIHQKTAVFDKALLALLLISYIQPFVDGNKRTARIVSNALLMQHGYCPLSFRTVEAMDYKKAMLIFYEQNNISAFKKIFIDQFTFAVNTYF